MPDHLPDDELVVRSVRKNWLKKGVLQYNAYRPSANKTLISILRGSYGAAWCQAKSMHLLQADYSGIAVHKTQHLRGFGVEVVDAPQDFEGHAHIDHIDPPLPPNDPLSPEINRVLNERCKEMARIAVYHPDTVGSSVVFDNQYLDVPDNTISAV